MEVTVSQIRNIVLISYLSLLFLSSCNIINPAEPVPAYIKVEKFTMIHTPEFGTDSTKITDVFDYIDGSYQGSYELPAQFPVIGSGVHQLIFYAGITVNGISSTRLTYPFYESYIQNVNLQPGKVTVINPVTKYTSNTIMPWIEDFENGLSLVNASDSQGDIVILPLADANNYEGISGAVYLNESQSHFQIVTDTGYVLPKPNKVIYLEMNYKCNNSFTVGFTVVTATLPYDVAAVAFKPKATWNKVYVELGSLVGQASDAYSFKIFISATKDVGVSTAEFYFDNFKLLHN